MNLVAIPSNQRPNELSPCHRKSLTDRKARSRVSCSTSSGSSFSRSVRPIRLRMAFSRGSRDSATSSSNADRSPRWALSIRCKASFFAAMVCISSCTVPLRAEVLSKSDERNFSRQETFYGKGLRRENGNSNRFNPRAASSDRVRASVRDLPSARHRFEEWGHSTQPAHRREGSPRDGR